MAGATIAPALNALAEEFAHLPDAQFLAKLVLTLPSLIIALAAPFVGYAVDRFGRKNILMGAMLLYALAGCAGYLLSDMYMILISRAVLGIAVAGNMTTITTLVADYFEGEERNQFMGMQGGFMAIGGIVYVIIGAYLALFGWRYPFLIYAASLAVLPLVWRHVYEPERHYKPPEGYEVDYPKHIVGLIVVVGFIGMVIFYMVPVQMPFLLPAIADVGEAKVGLAIATTTVAAAPMAMLYQTFRKRLSFPVIYFLGFAIMGLGYYLIGQATSYWGTIGGLVVSGMGFGFMIPNATVWLMAMSPLHLRGRLIGILNMAMFLGQFFSPVCTEPISDRTSISFSFEVMGYLMFGVAVFFLLARVPLSNARPAFADAES